MILKGINIPTILIVSTEIDQRGSLKKETKSFTLLYTNIRLSARSKAHAAAASLWIYWISGGAGHPLVTCCPPRINFCIGQWVIVHRSAHLARLRATCLHRQPRGEVALIVRCQIRWTVWIDRSELPSVSQFCPIALDVYACTSRIHCADRRVVRRTTDG